MSEVAHDSASQDPPGEDLSWRKKYWKKNVKVLVVLLIIWASVSLGAGVLFIEQLNNIEILGFPLGLWFAQQGAIYTFVFLILAYALWMDRIDDQFGERQHNENVDRS